MGRRTKRKLLKRSDVPIFLWVNFILAAVLSVSSLYLLFAGIWRGGSVLSLLAISLIVVVSLAVLVSVWQAIGRKIVFLDKYISYTGWLGRPKVYRYEDVVDIQTVIVPASRLSQWRQWEFEDNVTIIFADRKKLRVPTSAMNPREVRRRIESKTGLRFESTLKL